MTDQAILSFTETDVGCFRTGGAMSEKLQLGYRQLMAKAPGAAFRRARRLYLNKYSFPQHKATPDLRLFVCDETLDETIQPAVGNDDEGRRIVTLTSSSGSLALVHWQKSGPAEWTHIERYLGDIWNLDLAPEALSALPEPWFRDGGHQMRFQAPPSVTYQQRSILSLQE